MNVHIMVNYLPTHTINRSGKFSFRSFEDERPIVSSNSFSSEAPINKDLELVEKTDQF